jgi:hypothetical protein
MAYTFSNNLLSAQKTGYPNLIGTSLSGVGVSFLSGNNVVFTTQNVIVVSLSTNDVGIAFNPVTLSVESNQLSTFKLSAYEPLVSVNVEGSVFLVPSLLNASNLAVVKVEPKNYTVFPWLSTTTTVPTSAITATKDVLNPNRLRLRLLGYA